MKLTRLKLVVISWVRRVVIFAGLVCVQHLTSCDQTEESGSTTRHARPEGTRPESRTRPDSGTRSESAFPTGDRPIRSAEDFQRDFETFLANGSDGAPNEFIEMLSEWMKLSLGDAIAAYGAYLEKYPEWSEVVTTSLGTSGVPLDSRAVQDFAMANMSPKNLQLFQIAVALSSAGMDTTSSLDRIKHLLGDEDLQISETASAAIKLAVGIGTRHDVQGTITWLNENMSDANSFPVWTSALRAMASQGIDAFSDDQISSLIDGYPQSSGMISKLLVREVGSKPSADPAGRLLSIALQADFNDPEKRESMVKELCEARPRLFLESDLGDIPEDLMFQVGRGMKNRNLASNIEWISTLSTSERRNEALRGVVQGILESNEYSGSGMIASQAFPKDLKKIAYGAVADWLEQQNLQADAALWRASADE